MSETGEVQRPRSATHALVAASGTAGFLVAVVVLRIAQPFGGNIVASALAIAACVAGAITAADMLWQKVWSRPSTGLDFAKDDPSWNRSLTKCIGFAASCGFVLFFYWLLPEYHGAFYDNYYSMLRYIAPVTAVLAVPYIYFVDRRMVQPKDGYCHLGQLVLLEWREVDPNVIRQHLLGWTVKGFFLPLMFVYMCADLQKFLSYPLSGLVTFQAWFDFLYFFFYFVDVGLVSVGYLMALRLTDTHFRSAEPTPGGWIVALVCYEPFWSVIGRQYFAYGGDIQWGDWLYQRPAAYCLWGGAILVLTAAYVWATTIFGARFSNLSNRGIITNGPYRWTRHPAYLAKNLSWWLVSVPFLAGVSPAEQLRHCLMLLGVNCIYFMRAKTEERHLASDPAYRQYSAWIDSNGLFAPLRRLAEQAIARAGWQKV